MRYEFKNRKNKKLFTSNSTWTLEFAWDEEEYGIFWIDFQIYQIVGEDDHGQLYQCEDGSLTPDHNEAEIIVGGFIKWDECCQWDTENVHTDSIEDLRNFCEVIQTVYSEAKLIFGG